MNLSGAAIRNNLNKGLGPLPSGFHKTVSQHLGQNLNSSTVKPKVAQILAYKKDYERKEIYKNMGFDRNKIEQIEHAIGYGNKVTPISLFEARRKLFSKGIFSSSLKNPKQIEETLKEAKLNPDLFKPHYKTLIRLGEKRIKMNIGQVKASEQLMQAKKQGKAVSLNAPADSSNLGIAGAGYNVSAGGAKLNSQDLRNSGTTAMSNQLGQSASASAVGEVSNKATSISGSHGKNAAGIGGGVGTNKKAGSKTGNTNINFRFTA
jgi:hypothetical protein